VRHWEDITPAASLPFNVRLLPLIAGSLPFVAKRFRSGRGCRYSDCSAGQLEAAQRVSIPQPVSFPGASLALAGDEANDFANDS